MGARPEQNWTRGGCRGASPDPPRSPPSWAYDAYAILTTHIYLYSLKTVNQTSNTIEPFWTDWWLNGRTCSSSMVQFRGMATWRFIVWPNFSVCIFNFSITLPKSVLVRPVFFDAKQPQLAIEKWQIWLFLCDIQTVRLLFEFLSRLCSKLLLEFIL